jgi:hypothetical protein
MTDRDRLALRSQINVGVCARRSNTDVMASLVVSRETVREWRSRFVRDRVEG